MKKFVFNSVKAANLAKTANVAEKQQDANAKTLLTVANNPVFDSGRFMKLQDACQ